MTSSVPHLFTEIGQLVQPHLSEGDTRTPLTVTPNASLLLADGRVVAAGDADLVGTHPQAAAATTTSLQGRAVVPGLVDSHTHLVFAGERVNEFAMRTRGETYESIAAAGGGIVSSVAALQDCSLEALVAQSERRLSHMQQLGVTTVEIKSGYGLSPDLEAKQLDAIEILASNSPLTVLGTVLAHVVPKTMRSRREEYIEQFCEVVLPDAARREIVRYCDVFVENGAFTPDEATRISNKARELKLEVKLHVDQLHDGSGAALAAELGALSADHLEKTNAEGAKALADAGVVATILPGCGLFLGGDNWPAGRPLRDAGCSVAVATDCNPGSSMVLDLPLCGTLSATQCGLSLEEALWGITRGGAMALGLNDRGTLNPGERADFVVVDSSDWRKLFYTPGATPLFGVGIAGNLIRF